MIDPLKIQEELKDAKLTSMTQVISFVIEQVFKIMSYDPIQDLSYRIADLEKPKGLDQIMIEEVKTLIEAILQQKQEQIRKDLEKTVHQNLESALEHQQNTRRSMKELDVMQLINTANQSRKSSIHSMNRPEPTLELIKKQIQQMKKILEKKVDRREINERVLQIQKQVSKKMPLSDAERIVQKFQKQIFAKLNENILTVQKMQYSIKKNLLDDLHQFKKDFSENNKVKELKSSFNKVEKKVKRTQSEIEQVSLKCQRDTFELKSEMKDSIEQLCLLVESINQIKEPKKLPKKEFTTAVWKAETQYNINNMAICWSSELSNDDDHLYCFEAKKSQIMVVDPGYYKIEFIIYGCEKPPSLFINSEARYKIQQKLNKVGPCNYSLIELIRLNHQKSLISVKLQENNVYEHALLRLTRID